MTMTTAGQLLLALVLAVVAYAIIARMRGW